MLFRKIITGYSEKHSKYINTVIYRGGEGCTAFKKCEKGGIFGLE
jgi:hypothetical protein